MPRVSSKENKNIYFKRREELGLTRDKASELLEAIPPERIEKIENERCEPHPEEVLLMAEKYKAPELCNYYCSNQCPIGQVYVPEIKIQDLSQIVIKMLSSLNAVQDNQRKFIEISVTVQTLQLWSEQMLADGEINAELYESIKSKRNKTNP